MNNDDKPFIIDFGQNRLKVLIGSDYHVLKCRTLYQMERYQALVAKGQSEDPAVKPSEDAIENMRRNLDRFADICEIALNPTPDKTPYPKEKIVSIFEPDKIELLALIWLDRFFAPRKDPDPCLAPQRGGQ